MKFKESEMAHRWLDGLKGVEIGGSAHNAFGLDTINVDYTDDMTTEFKRAEMSMCMEAMPVDVVSRGDELPFANDEYDFVISSHVIEHFFDPIKAICEWVRVAKNYVFIICPHPDALESDRDKPITTLQDLIERNRDMPEPEVDTHEHYTRWTLDTFLEMCEYLGLVVCDALDPDDKVGNGFAVVIDVAATKKKHK